MEKQNLVGSRILLWGDYDFLQKHWLEESFEDQDSLAVDLREKDDVPKHVEAAIAIIKMYRVIVLPLTLPKYASLCIAETIHRTASPSRLYLKSRANLGNTTPLFDYADSMLSPKEVLNLFNEHAVRRLDALSIRAMMRRIFDDNFAKDHYGYRLTEDKIDEKWALYLETRRKFFDGVSAMIPNEESNSSRLSQQILLNQVIHGAPGSVINVTGDRARFGSTKINNDKTTSQFDALLQQLRDLQVTLPAAEASIARTAEGTLSKAVAVETPDSDRRKLFGNFKESLKGLVSVAPDLKDLVELANKVSEWFV